MLWNPVKILGNTLHQRACLQVHYAQLHKVISWMKGQVVASGSDPKDPTRAFSNRHGCLCMHVLIKNIHSDCHKKVLSSMLSSLEKAWPVIYNIAPVRATT